MLKLEKISHSYDRVPVLRDINLEVAAGEIFCLLGPSGCGKTTLLRTVAGLIDPDQGNILFDGKAMQHVPVHERDFGFMFQDFALFPHLNVANNVGFGLKMRGEEDQQGRVHDVLRLVGLQGFEHRDVTQLSGGEKQRVALARSLAPEPRLLMLDEPLGSLDAALRNQLVIELRHIIKSVGLTALYVTHDQQEAFAIADRMAIMNAGGLEQVGTPEAIYQHPATAFAARFMDLDNILPVLDYRDGQATITLGEFTVSRKTGEVLIHPLGIRLADAQSTQAAWSGVVTERVFLGDSFRLAIRHDGGAQLTFKIPADTSNPPAAGESVQVSVNPQFVVPLG